MGGLCHRLGWRAGGGGEVARIDGDGRREVVKRVPVTQKGDLGAEEEKEEEDEGPRG